MDSTDEAEQSEWRDVEAIKRLKARYCRFMDERRWDEFADLFTDDAVVKSGHGAGAIIHQPGGKVVAAGLTVSLSAFRTAHHATNPDIELIDADHASGSWKAMFVQSGGRLQGYGFYDDEFRRVDERWLISRVQLTTTFAEGNAVPPLYSKSDPRT